MTTQVKFSGSYSWVDADGNAMKAIATKLASCQYNVQLVGQLPVPTGLVLGAELDIPFTGLSAASFVYIENQSGQELGMAWGGNFSPNLPNGGMLCYAFPTAPVAGGISSLRFFLTAPTTAPGLIMYAAFG